MSTLQLKNIEETMTSLVAYLMSAPKKHSKHILDAPHEVAEVRSIPKMRVTQHYTSALLAYGFPSLVPELQRATEWFSTPFPRTKADEIDTLEMIKLEGLLNLRPDDPTVPPRLKQLSEQRENHFFVIPSPRDEAQDQNDAIFNSLWALKLFLLARSRGVAGKWITDTEIKTMLFRLVEIAVQDKDLALALRLIYELQNQLNAKCKAPLERLLQHASDCGDLWGISASKWERVKDIVHTMQRGIVTPSMIGEEDKTFRDMILNSCYVIENLAPLAPHYPAVAEALNRSIQLWWSQFEGGKAPYVLRSLFSEEYDFLIVLCRTIISVNALLGEPLGARFWISLIREKSQKFMGNDFPELKSIDHALRAWVGIELENIAPLKLGLSEANVVRIRPKLYNPGDEQKTNLLNTSLVVKYGPIEEVENERRNFSQLPSRIQSNFVNIPKESYVSKRRQAFVIMEDLSEFFTLFEHFDVLLKADEPRIINRLGEFLMQVHRGENETIAYATHNHLRELYISPLMQHIEYISGRFYNHAQVLDGQLSRFYEIERVLNGQFGKIIQYQHKLERFPLAYMHGDLHSRNIMIKTTQRPGISRKEADLTFKLIDLESVRADGDAAHDAGQLLVDLVLLPLSTKKSVNRQILTKLEWLQDGLGVAYSNFAQERNDATFATRLDLAHARALIRIAKGQTKRSERSLRSRDYALALDLFNEVMGLVERASIWLNRVANALDVP
jgi:Ecdysteroid kinase-like family